MNIVFTSLITKQGEDNKIEFTAPVNVSKENGFDVYEFNEPSQNVANRIEVSAESINIFAGPSSINLVLNRKVQNEYQTPHGLIYFISELHKVELKDNGAIFSYTLSNVDDIIGNFDITLKTGN